MKLRNKKHVRFLDCFSREGRAEVMKSGQMGHHASWTGDEDENIRSMTEILSLSYDKLSKATLTSKQN